MRRVVTVELVSVGGVMESPEEWGPHLLQRGDGGGQRIGDSSNMIVPLPSRMRRRARGGCSGENIDGRSDHDWPTADRPRHPVGERPAGQLKVLRGGAGSVGLWPGVRARWSPGLRKRGGREAHPIRGRAARRRGPRRLLRSQPGGGQRLPRRGGGGGRARQWRTGTEARVPRGLLRRLRVRPRRQQRRGRPPRRSLWIEPVASSAHARPLSLGNYSQPEMILTSTDERS